MENYFNLIKFKKAISICIILLSCNYTYGQFEEVDYSNPGIAMEDINAILQTLNIDVYKFGVNLPDSNKYEVCLYLEEYAEKELINKNIIWCTSSPYRTFKKGQMTSQPFDGARFIIKNNKTEFLINIRMGDFGHPEYKIKIDSTYSNRHLPRRFKIMNTTLSEGKTPLVLIGSFWETKLPDGKKMPDGSSKIFRFCMENELSPDFSNEAFEKMPHHYIIGVNVKKTN